MNVPIDNLKQGGWYAPHAKYFSDIWQLDTVKLTWIKIKQKNRVLPINSSSSVAIGNRLVTLFGKHEESRTNAIHSFNFETNEWVSLLTGNTPSVRSVVSCVCYRGSLYSFGGFTDSQHTNSLLELPLCWTPENHSFCNEKVQKRVLTVLLSSKRNQLLKQVPRRLLLHILELSEILQWI